MKKGFYVFLVFTLILTFCGCSKNSERKYVGYVQVCTIDYNKQLVDANAKETPVYEYYYDTQENLLFVKIIRNDKIYVHENQIKGLTISKAIKNVAYQGNVVEKTIELMENDKTLKSAVYDDKNNVKASYESSYDENWNLIEEKASSSDNSVSYWHQFEYEDGKRVRMIELSVNGEIRRKSDIMDTQIEEEYDQQNRVIKRVTYLDGEIKSIKSFSYELKDDIEIIEIIDSSASKEVMSHFLNTIEIEKDSNGKIVSKRVVNMDLIENISTTSLQSYDEFERLVHWENFEGNELTSSMSYSYENIYE